MTAVLLRTGVTTALLGDVIKVDLALRPKRVLDWRVMTSYGTTPVHIHQSMLACVFFIPLICPPNRVDV